MAYLPVLVVEGQRFLPSKDANYDRAWDNCGPGLRIEMLMCDRARLRPSRGIRLRLTVRKLPGV